MQGIITKQSIREAAAAVPAFKGGKLGEASPVRTEVWRMLRRQKQEELLEEQAIAKKVREIEEADEERMRLCVFDDDPYDVVDTGFAVDAARHFTSFDALSS